MVVKYSHSQKDVGTIVDLNSQTKNFKSVRLSTPHHSVTSKSKVKGLLITKTGRKHE